MTRPMPDMDRSWDPTIRWLHFGMALTITFQLFSSLDMSTPQTADIFLMHQIIGVTAACVIAAHWIWIVRYRKGWYLAQLFPWYPSGRRAVLSDLQGLLRGKLPESGPRVGLPSYIHGLGFLVMTGMGLTGVLNLLLRPSFKGMHGAVLFTAVSETHNLISYLAWAYWLGHVGIVVVHQIARQPVVSSMFGPRRVRQ
ncbi:cytochrome b/b6 domain-containing protein [Acidihalobacter prosperus]